MTVLAFLIPVSLFLGGLGLAAFLWMLRTDQFEDPLGQATRVLSDRWDDQPAPDPARGENPSRLREPASPPAARQQPRPIGPKSARHAPTTPTPVPPSAGWEEKVRTRNGPPASP